MDEHRSIQDIIPPARSKPRPRPSVEADEDEPPRPPTPPQPMRLKPEKSGFAKFVFIAAGVVVVLGIGIGILSTVFHKAYVTVTPYHFTADVQESLQATLSGGAAPYQKIEVTDTASKSVAATGSQHVENHASGTITIYNAYSTGEQRLITNTRFQTKDGLVFRIHAPVVVPGYTMKAGVKVPGSIDAVVYADQAGDTYNVGLSDFTVPGLKGTKQFDLITARSKTQMSGGFIGEQAVVDPALRSQTEDSLKADLDRSLRAKVVAAKVAGTVVFNDTVNITYAEQADTVSGNSATIAITGTAVAPAFDEATLARQFASVANASYQGPLSITNPQDISVHVDPASAVGTANPITVAIAGTANLVAVYDQNQLAADLAGKSKNDIQAVLPKYPAISAIDVKVYPFWLSSLPGSPAKLTITTVDTGSAVNP